MSDPKAPPKPATPAKEGAPAAAAGAATPDAAPAPEPDIQVRISQLHEKVEFLEKEIKTLQGRAANRNPKLIEAMTQENEALKQRTLMMEKALLILLTEEMTPHS